MRYLKYITGVVAGVALVGCSSFLEEAPDQRTEIDNPTKARELLVFAYPGSNYFFSLETMSDNTADSKRTQNSYLDNTAYYSWEDEKQESWDSPAEYWGDAYTAIAQANQTLVSLETMSVGEEELKAIKGEALLARAYAHWKLMNIFCLAYDPATAGSELGIPYVDEVEEELIKQYERGTLAEDYAKVEQDIVEGVELFRALKEAPKYQPSRSEKFHFTLASGNALAAEFFAFKGEWDKVLEYTEDLGDEPAGLFSMEATVELGPNQIGIAYGSDQTAGNLLVAGTRSLLNRYAGMRRFGATRDVTNAMRGTTYNPFNVGYYLPFYHRSQDVNFIPKFYEYFVYSNQAAGIGTPTVNVALLTVDEMYLYRIEAFIMKDQLDRAAKMMGYFAKSKMTNSAAYDHSNITANALIRKVSSSEEYQPFYAMTDSQRALVKFLAEQRRLTTVHTGARWFDIKRYNLPVTHAFLVEGTSVELTPKDGRKAVQLPQSALGAGLTPNPR